MKKYALISLLVILLTINLSAVQVYGQGDSKAKYQNSTIQLFNGQNLDGWYTFLKDRGKNNDPKKVFTVNNGLIRVSGEEWGCITTEKEYENYHLTVEFKWSNENMESKEISEKYLFH